VPAAEPARPALLARLLAGLVAAYFLALYLAPPLADYTRFELENFDFGMVFQSSFLLSQGRELLMTCRGVHAWADNQDYLQVVFAPFHWFPRAQQSLIAFHSLAAFAPGLLCLFHLWRRGPAVALGTAVLCWSSPFLLNMALDLLHIETLAAALLLLVYLAAKRGSRAGFWTALLAALAAKEDVALSAGLALLLYWLAARRFALPRAHFAAGLALSVAVFFLNLELVLPHYKLATCRWLDPSAAPGSMDSVPAAPAYREVLESWYKPAFLADRLLRRDALAYAALLYWPLLPFLRRPTLLWLAPLAGLFVNVVSSSKHLTSGTYHYDFATFAAVLVCVLEGLAATRRPARTAAALALLSLGANLAAPMRAPLYAPLTPGFFDLSRSAEVRLLEELDRLIPSDAVVSADSSSMCYLLEDRPSVYLFKNPFEPHFFGLYGQCTAFASPPAVDLVILARSDFEHRLGTVEALLPDDFARLDDGRTPFMVWLGPDFAARPEGRAVAELVREARAAD
jgi:uncharacterized membrane protein